MYVQTCVKFIYANTSYVRIICVPCTRVKIIRATRGCVQIVRATPCVHVRAEKCCIRTHVLITRARVLITRARVQMTRVHWCVLVCEILLLRLSLSLCLCKMCVNDGTVTIYTHFTHKQRKTSLINHTPQLHTRLHKHYK